jgi:hypothetical protein
MEDPVSPGEQRLYGSTVPDVRLLEPEIRIPSMLGQIALTSNRQIIYRKNVPSLRNQKVDKMTADEACASGYDV